MGANTLTITCGHTIDALRFVVGDFRTVSAVVSTQAREWLEVEERDPGSDAAGDLQRGGFEGPRGVRFPTCQLGSDKARSAQARFLIAPV